MSSQVLACDKTAAVHSRYRGFVMSDNVLEKPLTLGIYPEGCAVSVALIDTLDAGEVDRCPAFEKRGFLSIATRWETVPFVMSPELLVFLSDVRHQVETAELSLRVAIQTPEHWELCESVRRWCDAAGVRFYECSDASRQEQEVFGWKDGLWRVGSVRFSPRGGDSGARFKAFSKPIQVAVAAEMSS